MNKISKAKVNIYSALKERGWDTFYFNAYATDKSAKNYTPAIAIKNGFILCIDISSDDVKNFSGKEKYTYIPNINDFTDDNKINKLKKITQKNGATSGEEANAKELIDKIIQQTGQNREGLEKQKLIYPLFMANPDKCKWHIEKDGKIYDKGNVLTKFSEISESYNFDFNSIKYNYKKTISEEKQKVINDFKDLIFRFENIVNVKNNINNTDGITNIVKSTGLQNCKVDCNKLAPIEEEYNIYFKKDSKEYYLGTLNKKQFISNYNKLKECIEPFWDSDRLLVNKLLSYNKIVISYPIFDYNIMTFNEYPFDYIDFLDDFFSDDGSDAKYELTHNKDNKGGYALIKTEYTEYNCKFVATDICWYDTKILDSLIRNNELINIKLPLIKTKNKQLIIDFKNEVCDKNNFGVKSLYEYPTLTFIEDYKEVFILRGKYYIPVAVDSNHEYHRISYRNFNNYKLLNSLIKKTYNYSDEIEEFDFLDFYYLKDVDLIKNVVLTCNYKNNTPIYTFYPYSLKGKINTEFGSLDNKYFNSKGEALLYASNFQDVLIYDKSTIPYIKQGLPFDINTVDFDMLSQIQQLDKIYNRKKFTIKK